MRKRAKKRKESTRKSDKSDTIKKGQNRTKEKQELFLNQFPKNACNVSVTCKSININRDTYYDWLRKFPKFAKACKDAEESLIDYAESKLMHQIDLGNMTAIIFFLCNRGEKRGWRHVNKIDVGLSEGMRKYLDHMNRLWGEENNEK